MQHLKKRSKGYLRRIISGKELYKHLVRNGYFPEAWVLPPFLDVTFSDRAGYGDQSRREPVSLFAPKTSIKWREFSIIHPNNFKLVAELLSSKNYLNVLSKLSSGGKIFSYSLPLKYSDDATRAGTQISQWSDMHDDLMTCVPSYQYLLSVDVSNCYHSMYTHALEWASGSAGYKSFGDKLDTAIRRGFRNHTHGLPVGPRITDYIAEIVMCAIDRDIEICARRIDFVGTRYKDNYFIMCKTQGDAEQALKCVAKSLRTYHLDVNTEKSEVIESSNYFSNLWRTDFNLLTSQLGFDRKIKNCSIARAEAYVSFILRMASSQGNQRAVVERATVALSGIRPAKSNYPKFFTLVSRLYKGRFSAMPKVLLLMSDLASENVLCAKQFERFLESRLKIAQKLDDEFELLWLVYFATFCSTAFQKRITPLVKTLQKQGGLKTLMAVYFTASKLSKPQIISTLWPGEKNTAEFDIVLRSKAGRGFVSKLLAVRFGY